MRKYDLSPDGSKYYRQNNNALDPGMVCKPTSTVMALDVAGWPIPSGKYPQPEDNLTALCRTPDGIACMLNIDSNLRGTPPNEVWNVIKWAVNQWYPRQNPIIGPRWDWTLREALYGIARFRRPFATSTWLTKGGHVVMIAGYVTEQDRIPASYSEIDIDAIKQIIVDDPYGLKIIGNGYDTDKTGYHTMYSLSLWREVWRGIGIQVRRHDEN